MDEIFDVLVIGSGPAGVSAALTARHRGKSALIITTAPEDSPLCKAEHVDNYPGLPAATGAELIAAFVAHAEKSGVKFARGRALAVADLGGTFGVSVGADFVQGRSVVFACGLTRAKPYPGEAEFLGRGVSYCATCDGMLYRNKDVAVIGLSDARLGEIAAAVIEVKPGRTLTEEEVNRFCLGMPRYKRPRKIIFAEIPRNPTGKIEKPKLRKRYAADSLVARQNEVSV